MENAFDNTYKITAVEKDKIEEEEPKLLKEAFSLMPKILLKDCHVLIVKEMGKNISGDGMDTNVTGIYATKYASGGLEPQKLGVLSLTEQTHGNANGVGMADAIPKHLLDQIDFEVSYPNPITSTLLNTMKIPIVMKNDKEVLQLLIRSCNDIDYNNPRVIIIKNTLELAEIQVSQGFFEDVNERPDMDFISGFEDVVFDENGNLY